MDISDPLTDIQATGKSVIEIYNARIAEARQEYDDLRLLAFVRNIYRQEFTIFERPLTPLVVNNYQWKLNRNNNLEGYEAGQHALTWQRHGSQFTIIEVIPDSATRFSITRQLPTSDTFQMEQVLQLAGFSPEWIEIVQ